MRRLLATLALAGALIPSTVSTGEPALHVAQMARDVTDAVRKQRAERRTRSRRDHQPDQETKR
jgi:hypothetical protein